MNISMIGTGSFGTSLAMVLDSNHHNVLMYGRNEQTINEINNNHSNKKYLKDIELNESIRATNDLKEAVTHGDLLVLAVPVKAIRTVSKEIINY